MEFKKEIQQLEEKEFSGDYVVLKGGLPILFTAPHTMEQKREDGTIKLREPYTKAIALYLNKKYNVNCMIKIKDTGLDSNRDNNDNFKKDLVEFIEKNKINLVIDLHGASMEREFDVEFGTMNNVSASFSTIKELEEAFIENGIKNVEHNNPFKGGAITQYCHMISGVDCLQVEINRKYRDFENIEKLEKLCESFGKFILQYKEYTK